MPTKKKNNYISYEIQKLDTYIKSIQKYLDDNPIDEMRDRLEVLESTRGNPIIKVIATKESQIKCYMDRLKELPRLVLDVNELRKIADGQKLEIATRGDVELPGFMDDQEENETEEQPTTYKALPASTKQEDEDHNFDDDSFWEQD